MTGAYKLILVLLVLLAIEGAWLCRWGIVPAATEDESAMYQLDRWTGDIYWIEKGEKILVKGK